MTVWSGTRMVPKKNKSGCRRSGEILGAFALMATLSACKMFVKDDPPPCPRISISAETSSITRFAGGGTTPADMIVQAKMNNYTGSCHLDSETHRMTSKVAIEIDATRGPAMVGDTVTLEYFIAVPAYFPTSEGKKLMPVTLTFPSGAQRIHYVDQPSYIDFPVVDQPGTDITPGITIKDLAKYETFFGWQLNSAELAYNRKQAGTP